MCESNLMLYRQAIYAHYQQLHFAYLIQTDKSILKNMKIKYLSLFSFILPFHLKNSKLI